MADFRFSKDGDLIIPAKWLGKLGGGEAKQLRRLELVDDLLICADSQPGQRSQSLLYGDLRLFHVAELIALVSSMGKAGALTLYVPDARKVIYFADGEVVYASSNVEDDRLGEVLWRRGYLSLEQLSKVHDLVTPGKKLGRVLIDHGMLTPRKLYEGLKEQVLEIVHSTFHFNRGEFVFVESKVHIKGSVRLDKTARDVIREGVQRLQELTRLEELFPDRETVLAARPVKVDVKLDDHELHLIELIDGKRSVQALIEASHLGEFETLKGLARLVTVGRVGTRSRTRQQQREQGELPDVLAGYARLLRRIHQTLVIESPDSVRRLEDYPASPAPSYQEVFKNVSIDEDGKLDVDTLYRNARRLESSKARELSLGALRALYDYAVFQAMDVLGDEACDALMDRLDRDRAKLDD